MSYIHRYANKTGDRRVDHRNYKRNRYGFSSWYIEDGKFFVSQLCGDLSYWKGYIIETAKRMGKEYVYFWTTRQPKAWAKHLKLEHIDTVNGRHLIKCPTFQ